MQTNRIYYISGYNDITDAEFEYYKRRIRIANAHNPNCTFILGDASGCDRLAQEYLRTIGVSPARITIYYKKTSPTPVNKYNYKLCKCGDDNEKFSTMIYSSTDNIAYVRSGDTDSVPAQSVKRRRKIFINNI